MTKPHKTLSQAIIMNSYWGKVPREDTEFILSDGSRGTSQLANKTKDGATTKKGRIIQLMVISQSCFHDLVVFPFNRFDIFILKPKAEFYDCLANKDIIH